MDIFLSIIIIIILLKDKIPSFYFTEATVINKRSRGNEFVYFIYAPEVNRLKIGKTKQTVSRRLSDLQTGSPCKLHLLGYIKTNDCTKLEYSLHERYKSFRTRDNNEWFEINRAMLNEIKDIAHYYNEKVERLKK